MSREGLTVDDFSPLVAVVERMRSDDYPRNGVCTHHGEGLMLHGWSVGFAPSGGGRSLVTVYWRPYEFPAAVHQGHAEAVQKAFGCGCVDRWNGDEGHPGISLVLDLPAPPSLIHAINNYRQLASPFRLTAEDEAGFKAWNDWLDRKGGAR